MLTQKGQAILFEMYAEFQNTIVTHAYEKEEAIPNGNDLERDFLHMIRMKLWHRGLLLPGSPKKFRDQIDEIR